MPNEPKINLDPDFIKAINKGTNVSNIETTIKPSKEEGSLDDYKKYFDEGQIFQNKGLNDARAKNQPFLEELRNIGLKGGSTFLGSIAETAGTIVSLPTALTQLAAGDTKFMDNWLSNPLMKGIDNIQKDIQENLPVYLSQEQQNDKTISGYITDPERIFDDLTQGVAFLASMYVPMNWVMKPFQGAKLLSKVTKAGKALDEAGSISKWFEAGNIKKLQELKPEQWAEAGFKDPEQLVDIQTKIGRTQKLLEKTGQFTGAVIGRLGESAMESNQTYTDLIDKGVTEDKAREAANNVFYGNMLLSVVDYYQFGKLFGKAGGKKLLQNEEVDDALKNIVLEEGEKALYKVPSRLEKLGNNLWNITKVSASEGYEELQQYEFQEAAKKLALDDVDQTNVNGLLKFIDQSITKLPQGLTELDGQKSALLGALLGGLGSGLSNVGRNAATDKLGQERVNLFNTINENKYDPEQLFLKNEDGEVTINNEYLRNLNNFSKLEAYKDIANKNNDKTEYQRLNDLQLLNKAISYSLIGKEDNLVSTLETLKDTPTTDLAKILNIDENDLTDNKVKEIVDEKINKVKRYFDVLESINSDPKLSNLNLDAKRLIAYKLGSFEINKDAIDNLQPEIASLESKNLKNTGYLQQPTSIVEGQELNDKSIEESLKAKNKIQKDIIEEEYNGLDDNDKEKLNSLKFKEKQLLDENKKTLNWYNKQREDISNINNNIKQFNDIKKDTNIKNAANKEVVKQSETENIKSAYEQNTSSDDEGNFISSEFKVNIGTDKNPDNRTLVFTKDSPNYLVDKDKSSSKFYNVEELLNKSEVIPIDKIKQVKENIKWNKINETRIEALKNLISIKEKLIDNFENKKENEINKLSDNINKLKEKYKSGDKRKVEIKKLIKQIKDLEQELEEKQTKYYEYLNVKDTLVSQINFLKEELTKAEYNKQTFNQSDTNKDIQTIINSYNDILEEYNFNLEFLKEDIDKERKIIDDLKTILIDTLKRINNSNFNKNDLTDLESFIYNELNEQLLDNPEIQNILEHFQLTQAEIKKLETDVEDYKNSFNKFFGVKSEKEIETKVKLLNEELSEYNKLYNNLKEQNKKQQELQNKVSKKDKLDTSDPETSNTDTLKDVEQFDPIKRKSITGGFFTTSSKHLDNNNELSESESVKRFHSFTSSINNNNVKKYQGLVITKDHNLYGVGKAQDLFKEVGEEFKSNAILLLIVDDKGSPVDHLGGLVYSNIQLPNLKYSTFGESENRFYDQHTDNENNPKSISKQLEDKYIQDFIKFRNTIIEYYSKNNSDNLFVSIEGVSDGIPVKEQEFTRNLVLGNILNNKNELITNIKDIPIIVTTGEDITINGVSNKVKSGKIYTISNTRKILLNTRKVNEQETNDAVRLIKLYYELLKNKQKEFKIDNNLVTPKQILESFLYLRTQKDNQYQLQVYNEALTFGETTIPIDENSLDQIINGIYDEQLKTIIQNKPHQINKKLLDNNKSKFNQYTFNTTDQKWETTKYNSYKEYLLNSNNPALSITIKTPIPNNINTPSFIGAYLKFGSDLRPSTSKKVEVVEQDNKPTLIETREYSEIKSILEIIQGETYYHGKDKSESFKLENLDKESVTELKDIISKEGKIYKKNTSSENKEEENTIQLINALSGKKISIDKSDNSKILYRLSNINENSLDYEKAKQWLENNLPKEFHNKIEQVIGLIAGNKAGAVIDGGRILLSNLAGEGTEYHEAWHIVSQFLLNDKERNSLYNEYRTRTNNRLLSNYEVEEKIAEEFRTYVLLNENYKIPNEQKSFFDKIIDFLKSLIGLVDNNPNKLEEIFSKINSGGFINSKILTTELQNVLNSDNLSPLGQLEDSKLGNILVKNFNIVVGNYLFDRNNGEDIKVLFNNKFKFTNKTWEDIYQYIKDTNGVELPRDYYKKLIQKYSDYIQRLGLRKESFDDEFEENSLEVHDVEDRIFEEEDTDTIAGFMDFRSSLEVSTKDGLPQVIKMLISMLPSGIEELNMEQSVDYDYTLNYLQNLLAGEYKLEDMIDKIKSSNLNPITIKVLLDRLKIEEEYNNISSEQFDLQTAFYSQFNKTKNDFLIAIIDDDKVYFKNTNKNLVRNKIKDLWKNNLKVSPYTKIIDGKIILDTEKLSKLSTKTFDDKLNYLKAIGIEFSSPDKLPSDLFDTNKSADFSKIEDAINKTIDISNIFSKENSITSRLNALIEEELKNTNKIVENQVIGSNGKTKYGITLNNFLTNTINKLSKGEIPEYLKSENNNYTTNSIILERIEAGLLNSIKVNILEGIAEDNGNNKVTEETTKGERLLQQINSIILNNTYSFLRAESSKTEYSFELSNPIIDFKGQTKNQIIDESIDIFYGYLLDEIEQSKLSKNYKGQQEGLIIFKDIVSEKYTFNPELYKDQLKAEIEKYLKDQVSDNFEDLFKYEIVKEDSKSNLSIIGIDSYNKVNNSTKVNYSGIENLVASYTINSLAMNIEQSKLFIGDFRYYNNPINLFKRNKLVVGTKLPLRTDSIANDWLNENFKRNDGKLYSTTFKTLVIDDYIKNLVNEELKKLDYSNVNIADAQGIFNLDFTRELLKRSNRWTDEQELSYQNQINQNNEDEFEFIPLGFFQPQKPQYFGNQISEDGFIPTSYKFAAYTLYPSLSEDFPILKQLYELMTNKDNPFDMILFDSGNKSGRKLVNNKTIKLFNEDGTITIPDNYLDFIQETDLDNFGIQVENKPLEKDLVTTGTQFRAVLTTNTYNEGKQVNELGKLTEELNQVFNDITSIYTSNFLDRFNFKLEGDNYIFKGTKDRLKEILISELKQRDVPLNIYNSVKILLKESESTEFDTLVNKNKIENILFSIINNSVIKQKMKGDMKAQVSSAGFSFDKGETSKHLKFYEKNTSTGKVNAAEVFLPYHFKDLFHNIDNISEELRTIIAYRIPTEQLNSIDVFIIKGFLPEESGNMIIVPEGLTIKSGSDFDFDKLTVFFPNISKSGQYINYDVNNKTIEGLQNRIIEITKEIVLNNSNFENLVQPNNTKKIEKISEKIQSIKRDIEKSDNKNLSFTRVIELRFINNIAEQYWKGKSLISIFALHNKIHSLFQQVNGSINRTKLNLHFTSFNKIDTNYSLGRVFQLTDSGNNSTEKISNLNGSLISLTVDIGKNPDVLYNLNVSFDTADTISMLARLGLNTETIFSFINQPIIKHYLDSKELKGSLYQDNYYTNKELVLEAFKKLGLGKQQLDIKEENIVDFNSNILQDEISNPTLKNQSQIIQDFLHYKSIADQLAVVNRTLNADTSGVGKNRNFTNIKKKQIEKLLSESDQVNSLLFGINDLANKTFLKEFINVVRNVSDVWNEFFLTSKVKEISNLKSQFLDKQLLRLFNTDKINKVMDTFDNDLIQYIIQSIPVNKVTINSKINELFKSDKSFAIRLNNYLNSKDANIVLKRELQPLINRNGKISNVKLFSKKLNTIESNELTSALRDMFEQQSLLAKSMMEFIILQSGFNNSPINFIHVIPVEYWQPFVKEYINNFKNYTIDLLDFEDQFYKNNWSNNDIVPYYKWKEKVISTNIKTLNPKYFNQNYIKIVRGKGDDKKVYLYKNYAVTTDIAQFKLVNKFGDGIYLKEYGVDNSIIQENNIDTTLEKNIEAFQREDVNENSIIPIILDSNLRTWDLDTLEGTKQSEMQDVVNSILIETPDKPIEGGESFNIFSKRILDTIKKQIKIAQPNTVILTHNSVFGLIKLWDKENRTNELDKLFRETYTKQDSETGEHYEIKGDNGSIFIARHGQTEDNISGNFRTNTTQLTDEGRKQAIELGKELKSKNISNIITSDLNRTIETSNIIINTINPNLEANQLVWIETDEDAYNYLIENDIINKRLFKDNRIIRTSQNEYYQPLIKSQEEVKSYVKERKERLDRLNERIKAKYGDILYNIIPFGKTYKITINDIILNKIRENKEAQLEKEAVNLPDEVLDNRLKDFLNKLGIETNFDGVRDNNGNIIKGTIARAKFIQKSLKGIIDINEGLQKIDTLAEESTHFLVWMLRGTSLYNSLLSDIKQYPEQYNEVKRNYNLDENSIEFKEEVITKIITDIIVKKHLEGITEQQQSRVARWFNKVLEWFRNKLNLYTSDPYNKAALKVLFGDTSNLSLSNIKEIEAYQLEEDEQKRIDNLIDKSKLLKSVEYINKVGNKERGYELTNTDGTSKIIIEDTVTKWRDRENKKQPIERTNRIDFLQQFGTNGHKEIENSINSILGKEERVSYINNKSASDKIDIFAKNLVDQYRDTEGNLTAQFYTEVPIIDEQVNKGKGRAGTMDLIVVNQNGIVDIYDWKFIDFYIENGTSSLNFLKQKDFETQLNEYRRILKQEYGLKVGKTRIIPINVKITNQDGIGGTLKDYHLKSIEIQGVKYQEDKPYLNAFPTSLERTGIESIDDIINGLQTLKNNLELQLGSGKGFDTQQRIEKEKIARRIKNINNAIIELQLNKTGKNFLREAEYEIEQLFDTSNLSSEALLYGIDLITFYKNIDFTVFYNKEDVNINNKINSLVASLNTIHNILKEEQKQRLTKQANEEKIDNINQEQRELGYLEKYFSSLSQQTKPKLKLLWKLIKKSKDKSLDEYYQFIEKIKIATNKVLTTQKDFNWMVKTDRNGNKTLINKFSEESNKKIKELKTDFRINKSKITLNKLQEYFNFNEKGFNEGLERESKYWQQYYKDITDNKERNLAIKKKIDYWKQRHDIKLGGLYGSFAFISRKEDSKFYSDEYNKIQATPELKEFYDLFTNFIKESSKWLDVDIQGNFLPQVPVSMIQQLKNSPLSISGMKEVFLNQFVAKRDESGFGQINELTGRVEYTIPTYYIEKIGERASSDLGEVLALWASMAYNNKNMQSIETSVKLLRNALYEEKGIVTTLSGKEVKNADGETQTALNQSSTIDAFNQYMNNALYGINNDKDSLFTTTKTKIVIDEEGNKTEVEETKQYSRNRILNWLLKFSSSKALGLNLISGFANLFGGFTNVIIEGSNGRFYKKRDFVDAAWKITRGVFKEQKVFTMMRYWDIMGDMEVRNRAAALSVDQAERFFTYDKIYILQKKTDSLVYNTILISMLNNYTLNNEGIIVKKKSKDDLSLYDKAEIKEGELFIEGLTNTDNNIEYRKFRSKVLEVGKQLVGQAPTYDVLLINNSIWGRMLMQFRGWIPRMIGARWRNLQYNENIEEWEEGRLKGFFEFLKTNYIAAVTDVLGLGGLLKKDGFHSISFEERMKTVYNKLPIETRTKLSFDEYLDLKKRQYNSALLELQLLISFFGLILVSSIKDDDGDDEKTYFGRLLAKSLNRAETEISFFYSIPSALKILKTPIPLMSFAKDIISLTENLFGEIIGEVIADEEMKKKNKPVNYFARLFPFTSEVARNIDITIEAENSNSNK